MLNFVELEKFPGYFIAHSPARLRRIVGNKILECSQTPNSNQDNYWTVTLKTVDGKYVKRFMHRLLMETFVPNPENKAHVNHIDGDKSNNALSNLEWATPKENTQHAVKTGLKGIDYKIKPVYQYSLSGKFITGFATDDLAQKATGIPKQNISKVTLKQRVHAGYFQWSRLHLRQMPPLKQKYIRGYVYQNVFYKNLQNLAVKLGYHNPEKASLSKFKKTIREQIRITYYE